MYELNTALSYVIPQRKYFSIGVIGLLATICISAIVWVVLVFFSVTERFEERWSEKIALLLGSARLEINTELYSALPENRIDLLSLNASYRLRRIKDLSMRGPCVWDSDIDEALPPRLMEKYKAYQTGANKRLPVEIKERLLREGIGASDFESLVADLSFKQEPEIGDQGAPSLNQYAYLIGRDHFALPKRAMTTTNRGFSWNINNAMKYISLLVSTARQDRMMAQSLFQIYTREPFQISGSITDRKIADKLRLTTPLQTGKPLQFQATLHESKSTPSDLEARLTLSDSSQSHSHSLPLSLLLSLGPISSISKPDDHETPPQERLIQLPLSYIPKVGYPLYVPQQLQQYGITLMTKATISLASSESSQKEESGYSGIPVVVCGFFDTGVLSIGGKVAIVSSQAINSLSSQLPMNKEPFTESSILLYPLAHSTNALGPLISSAQKVLDAVPDASSIFTIKTYRDYDTTKELFHQLSSEKNLFRLISIILLAAASSNIFCMLFILVHTKSKEIAILRALGSSKRSIQIIFTLAGALLGLFGAVIGVLAASLTLYFLPEILEMLSAIQGQEVLQSAIYGDIEKETINSSVLLLTFFLTSLTSSCAGWLASLKACRIDISNALRSN